VSMVCRWSAENLERRARSAGRPRRWFEAREEAVTTYLRMSGLAGLVDPGSAIALAGVKEDSGRYTLAASPDIYLSQSPTPADVLLQHARVPVVLATGELDPIATAGSLRQLSPDLVVIPQAGHNAHVTHPQAIASLIELALSRCGTTAAP
jgi:pimeloyl-ACP methyl ester carboxylesterase